MKASARVLGVKPQSGPSEGRGGGDPLRVVRSSDEQTGDALWRHYCKRLPLAMNDIREHCDPARTLSRGAWAVLLAVASHWQGKTDAFPGQDRLSMLTGYDVRSVRRCTGELLRAGFLTVQRRRRADGSELLHYGAGPTLLVGVDDFHHRYPDEGTKRASKVPPRPAPLDQDAPRGAREQLTVLQRELAEARALVAELERGSEQPTASHPADRVSGGPAERVSGELSDLEDHREPSSSCAKSVAPTVANEEEVVGISETDRDVARAALAEHRTRRFPGHRAALFEAGDVAMAAACSSVIDGDREAKMRAHLDALDGAFEISKGQPTARFIWRSVDHFLEHEQRGRRRRGQVERERARRSPSPAGGRRDKSGEACGDTATRLSAEECSKRFRVRFQLAKAHHANGACPYCNRPAEAADPVSGRVSKDIASVPELVVP